MPRLRIEKYYYRSGQLYVQNRYVNGEFHGRCRTWHRNGQLAEEQRYHHGLLHGVHRQWNAKGRLLGSFTMIHGTGVQQYWYDNGQLRSEFATRNGQFHGRNRGWLRDGTLIQEIYLIENHDVSRAVYLKEARKHPDWPQYADAPAGRVKLKGHTLEQRTLNLFAQSVMESDTHAEAKRWLETKPQARSLARFRSVKAALAFVKHLYEAGAAAVIIFAISTGKRKKLFADALLIQLPKLKSKRAALRKSCRDFCAKRGGATVPEKETGETHLYMMLA